ncbi:MAG: L-rhamnose isomerase, partial [Candidatus Humimicrobiaceae bacterium]
HVTLFTDEIVMIMQEIARADAFSKVYISTEFFDASINRIGGYAVGIRAVQKAMLYALLEPTWILREYEEKNQLFARLGLLEILKAMPYGDVWNMYCEAMKVPTEDNILGEVFEYEENITSKRH